MKLCVCEIDNLMLIITLIDNLDHLILIINMSVFHL